jgi:hypothetical protein
MRFLPLSLLVLVLLAPRLAHAHIAMTFPTPRTEEQKEAPCGTTGSARGDTVAVFRPGETISITWNETVDHAGHYRIAFDDDGDDDFVSPAGDDDVYNSPAVLADMIADDVGGSYSFEITLPDVECERCTIQLVQVMYGSGNYFQCADIALRSDAPGFDGGPRVETDGGGTPRRDGGSMPPGTTEGGCGCRVVPSAPDERSTLVVLIAAAVCLRSVRRTTRRR